MMQWHKWTAKCECPEHHVFSDEELRTSGIQVQRCGIPGEWHNNRYPCMNSQHGNNPNTQQTPEYTKDKYNVKIVKRKVSPKVSPTTYVGRRVKERRSERGEEIITK
jgi:hypothetical protein